jgi:hypothetical protein
MERRPTHMKGRFDVDDLPRSLSAQVTRPHHTLREQLKLGQLCPMQQSLRLPTLDLLNRGAICVHMKTRRCANARRLAVIVRGSWLC